MAVSERVGPFIKRRWTLIDPGSHGVHAECIKFHMFYFATHHDKSVEPVFHSKEKDDRDVRGNRNRSWIEAPAGLSQGTKVGELGEERVAHADDPGQFTLGVFRGGEKAVNRVGKLLDGSELRDDVGPRRVVLRDSDVASQP